MSPNQTPTSSETAVIAQPPAVVPQVEATPQPGTPAAQQASRDAVYEKYGQLYGQEPPQQQQQVAPAAAPQVIQQAPAVPAVTETESLKNRIADLERQIQANRPPANLPPLEVKPQETPTSWEDLLLAGKLKEAKEALVREVQSDFVAQQSPKIIQEAVEVSEAKAHISQFLTDLRAKNPDLSSMERYLASPVNMRVEEAQKAGRITTPAQYAQEYIAAVTAEIEELRKIKQQFVSAGREEASVRQREVLSSTPVPPNPIEQREATPSVEGQTTDPVSDYFAKRRQKAAEIRHLA